MDTARYFISLLALACFPPALMLWFAIHPYAAFWRRMGPAWTYTILAFPVAAVMAGIILARDELLAVDYGTSYVTTVLAVLSLITGLVIMLKRRKHLTAAIIAGIPELSSKQYPGKLLTEGIYARIRHPRYVEIFFCVLGYALFANYLATYIMVALSVPVLYLIVLLEERELRDRFGTDYDAYCKKVPRFVPKRSIRS
ncbi:MAG: methyltransferase family protein [Planctomycetota bacterium]